MFLSHTWFSPITLDSFSVAPLSGQLLPLYVCTIVPPEKQYFTLIFIESHFSGFRSFFQLFTIISKSSYASESACDISHSQGKLDFVARVCTVFQDDDQNGFTNNSF